VREGKESLFVANYVDTYGTPGYMKAAYEFTKATKPFIKRGAFLGVTGPKVGLLKGVTYFLQVDFKSFDKEQDALDFLVLSVNQQVVNIEPLQNIRCASVIFSLNGT